MKTVRRTLVVIAFFLFCSEIFAYRLKDEDVIVVDGVIVSCIYDISTKGNVIEIPNFLDNQTVTGIGDYAFSVAGKIAELILPSTLKTIGYGVFEGHALTNLIIPAGVTSIGGRAFFGNALSSINLPDGLKTIADGAFANNQLKGITLPKGIESVGGYAFQNNQIASLTLPDGIKSIGDQAFQSNQIASLSIPESLEIIGSYAFQSNQIASLSIPKRLEAIGWGAFSNNRISVLQFQSGSQLKEISGFCFESNDIKTLTLPNSVQIIYDGAFQNNPNLTKVTFGTNLLRIKQSAFNSCNLSSVSLPANLVFIGRWVFSNNPDLTEINLPLSAKKYQWNQSDGAKHNAGDKVTNLYDSYVAVIPYTLQDADVVVENGVIIGCSYFDNPANVASVITIPLKLDNQNITTIGGSVFYNRGISEIILPEGLVNIGSGAFASNEIVNITIPSSVVRIEDVAFNYNCINSISFETTSMLEFIGRDAFSANRLIEIEFPRSVIKIEKYAFQGNLLQKISFEENSQLLSIGSWAFAYNLLQNFTLPDPKDNVYNNFWVDWDNNKYSSNLVVTNFESFYKIPVEYTLTDNDVEVVDGIIVSYSPASKYANIIKIPEKLDNQTIIGIAGYVFRNRGLIGVDLPSTLRTIDHYAFAENEILKVTIPASVELINGGAFYGNNIRELTFEDKSKLRYIDYQAFNNNKISKLVLPEQLNYIGSDAFSVNLISNAIVIPDSVEYIGWAAFSNNQIPQLVFSNNSTLIYLGNYAFYNNLISNDINIPKTLTVISDYAFANNNISKVITHKNIVDYGYGAFLNNNPALKIVLLEPPTIPLVTHFFWWKDNDDKHYLPGYEITDYSKRYKAVIDQFFVVKFIVKDDNNQLIEKASIEFYGETLITDKTGIDSIGPVMRGNQDYDVSAAGCYGVVGKVNVQDDMTVPIMLVRYYNVTIKIVDVGNNPIPGANVNIDGSHLISDLNGNVQLTFPDGNYPFKVNLFGYNELADSVIVLDADKKMTVKLIRVSVNYFPNEGTGTPYSAITFSSTYLTDNNVFARNAYTFSHWNTLDDNSGTKYLENESITLNYSDIDLFAIWKPIDYNIIYHLDGGNNNPGNPAIYNIESEVDFLPATKPTLYFATWLDADSNRVYKIEEGNTGDIELWAVFTAEPTYFIDYHNLANATHNNQPIYTKFDLPFSFTDAYKRGYEFTGWCEDELLNKAITAIPVGSKKNYDIYANWGNAVEYDIKYNLDGGQNHPANPLNYTIESNNIIFESPSKTGGVFVFWYSDKELTKKITGIPAGSIGDTMIYAKWDLDIFDIQYVLNGGNNHPDNPANYTVDSNPIGFESPTKAGAEFIAWYSDKELTKKITGLPTGSLGDTIVYAKWKLVSYNIQYVLNGGNNHPDNPASYNVESKPINFKSPAKDGAAFVAWYSDKELTKKITGITKGSVGDTIVYAKWDLVSYDIQYVLDGGNNHPDNPSNYTVESKPINFESPTKPGAVFVGWFNDKELTKKTSGIPTGSLGDKIVFAKWELNGFAIHYVLNGGINHPDNPLYFTIESKLINFESPSKPGAVFVAWYSDKDLTKKITGIPSGSVGDTTIYAKWDLDIFDIKYVLDGGINHPANPVTYTIESNTIQFELPSKAGAAFVAWYTDKDLTEKITEIPHGNIGDTTIYAKWELNGFKIHYEMNGGINHSENPSYFTIESDPIIFESPTKTGGVFVAWYVEKEFTNKITGIPTGSIGDTTIYAKWVLDVFDIQYGLNGGINHPMNPDKYTVESSQIDFATPTKTGASFVAWYGDNALTKEITGLPTGSIGDTIIYAKWELDVFDIQYELYGGKNHLANPANYTIESNKIILESPSKAGASFVAWFTEKELNNEITNIPKGSMGDTTVFAKWVLDTFEIQYVLNGGNNHLSNPLKYTVESSPINFEKPSKTGSSFIAWYSDNVLTNKITGIPTGSIGDTILFAKWELDTFEIQYVLNGGNNHPSNPGNYTFQSNNIIFETPSKTGANFVAWYSDKEFNSKIAEIPQGSLGDTTIFAKWELDTFDIQYMLDGGINHHLNPAKYTIESETIVFENPIRNGFIFDGWYSNSNLTSVISTISKGNVGDRTIYAKWIELFKVNFIITTDSVNPARDVDIVIGEVQYLYSDSLGLADTLIPDGRTVNYSIEINGIVIDDGTVTVAGSDITIKVKIVDCYLRWYDVLFCDNGKGLWTDFVWYKDNVRISEEQFFHNPGGIQSGSYKLAATSVAGVEYYWELDFKTFNAREKFSEYDNSEMTVFPNPIARGSTLNISISENIDLQTTDIVICNVNGTVILTISNPRYVNKIFMDDKFSSGLYHVILLDETNKRRIVKEVILY